MTRRGIMVGGLLVTLAAAPAMAQRPGSPTPQAIARRCVANIHGAVHRTNERIDMQTRRCVHKIEELQANGDDKAAGEAAAACMESINRMAENSSNRIAAMVQRCLTVLTELEAPEELFGRVQQAADRGAAAIETHRAGAVQRIADALGG